MPLFGNLASMPLPDLIQWIGNSRKTGTLQLERKKVSKRIYFREGRIIACSTEDPNELLGHFLVSRGRITEEVLRQALSRQEITHQHLGAILVDLGAIDRDDLIRHLEAKAEETIFSLFEWEDAEFRFHDNQIQEPNIFPVSLRVEDVLLRGAQRFDELRQIRSVFDDPGIVLRRTNRLPPAEVFRNRMARRICEMVDGERTVAEILLQAHGSEYLVTKFLYELHHNGYVEIAGRRTVPHDTFTPPVAERPAPPPVITREPEAPAPHAHAPPVWTAPSAGAAVLSEPVAATPPPAPASEMRIDEARRMMASGDYDEALDILNAAYAAQPGNDSLRRMIAEAEVSFVEKAYRHYLPPARIPVLVQTMERLAAERLSPAEYFLLSRIDGSWDVKSIIQITPLREVDVLRTLKRMREKGFIELHDPA
jgi:hypothetical protein